MPILRDDGHPLNECLAKFRFFCVFAIQRMNQRGNRGSLSDHVPRRFYRNSMEFREKGSYSSRSIKKKHVTRFADRFRRSAKSQRIDLRSGFRWATESTSCGNREETKKTRGRIGRFPADSHRASSSPNLRSNGPALCAVALALRSIEAVLPPREPLSGSPARTARASSQNTGDAACTGEAERAWTPRRASPPPRGTAG